MSVGPTIATDPLELLENDGTRKPGLLTKYYGPIVGGLFGYVGVVVANFTTRRPLMSGIQKHILAISAGIGIGQWLENFRNNSLAERDAVFRHYIQLHPEDFPPRERYK